MLKNARMNGSGELLCERSTGRQAVLDALTGLEADLRGLASQADARSYDSRSTMTEVNVAVGMESAYDDAADLVAQVRDAFTPEPIVIVADVPMTSLTDLLS